MSKDLLGFVDGLNLYEYIANQVINLVDPSGQAKRSADECCKAAWDDPRVATPDGEKPPLGIVICCDGQTVVCARKRNVKPKDNRLGIELLLQCVLAHEKVHALEHLEDCPCDGISRPKPIEADRLDFYECEGHLAELKCLMSSAAKCRGDKECIRYLKKWAFLVTEEMRSEFGCKKYGITYPDDWRDSF